MSREEAQALSRSLKKPRYGNAEIYLAITTEVRGVDPETEAQRSNGVINVNFANKVVRVVNFYSCLDRLAGASPGVFG